MIIEVIKKAEEALSSMDSETLVSLYADDFVFVDTSTEDYITEKSKLMEYFDRLFSMPGVTFSEVRFFGMGNRAAGEWTWGGKSIQSRNDYSIRGASLFLIEGDRIREERIFYDPRSAFE